MPEGACLGFDFGLRRIGVACGQQLTGRARALVTLQAREGVPDWVCIQNLIDEWGIGTLVIGAPFNMDGSEQAITRAARQFASTLRQRYALPVYEVDERLTTVEARRRVFEEGGYRKLQTSEIDSIAAQLILEQWMARQADEEIS